MIARASGSRSAIAERSVEQLRGLSADEPPTWSPMSRSRIAWTSSSPSSETISIEATDTQPPPPPPPPPPPAGSTFAAATPGSAAMFAGQPVGGAGR